MKFELSRPVCGGRVTIYSPELTLAELHNAAIADDPVWRRGVRAVPLTLAREVLYIITDRRARFEPAGRRA